MINNMEDGELAAPPVTQITDVLTLICFDLNLQTFASNSR